MKDVQFVDELPAIGQGSRGKWANLLQQVMKRPGQWALIATCESMDQANSLQSNLTARSVVMPEPTHHWEFAARGIEVYAIYRGKRKASDASLRRANRTR